MIRLRSIKVNGTLPGGTAIEVNGLEFRFDRDKWETEGEAFYKACLKALNADEDAEALLLEAIGKWKPDLFFDNDRNLIDVTCSERPDTDWKYTDPKGHVHQWYDKDGPATVYNPRSNYTTPTLVWVTTHYVTYYDGEKSPRGYYRCRKWRCGHKVEPRYTADNHRQYVAGLTRPLLNGHPVTQEFAEKLVALLQEQK